ncbi:MAG TPA: alpha/beta hydrolase [Coleofasciculaceae cyanobacterium]
MKHNFLFQQVSQRFKSIFPRRLSWFSLLLGTIVAIVIAFPVSATERVFFSFGLFERSISVDSLEAYADTGTVNPDLAAFLRLLDPTNREELRTVLTTRHQISPVAISHIFYAPLGETSLRYIGHLIQTGKRQNGQYALRSALILAAAKPEGFTLLDVLRHYPTRGMRIDLAVALEAYRQGDAFLNKTNAVIAGIDRLAQETASDTSPSSAEIQSLQAPGPFQFSTQTITLVDTSRHRTYPADLYLPDLGNASSASVPVAIISHGFGSSRKDFADVAQHFASYGFAVALPEHIGSDAALQQALLQGRAFEALRPSEFVDRPLDVSFLLDELERRNSVEWQGRLNLKHVAMLGHSFGAYTSLVLGGGTADFANLHHYCDQDSFLAYLNPALTFQCRALALESSPEAVQQLTQGLQDPRISLVIAVNPVSSAILGPQGLSKIQVPIVIVGSGYDVAAPLVPEQAYPFTWLTAPEKYLVLVKGASHIPQLTAAINRTLSPTVSPEVLEQDIKLLRSNAKAVLLAFLEIYLNDRTEYTSYLQPFYLKTLNDPPFEFSLIRSLTEDQISEMIRQGAN